MELGVPTNSRSVGASLASRAGWQTLKDESPGGGNKLFVRGSIECRVKTQWGDSVVMCGSTEQLGGWRPERALRMTTDDAIYPVWRCEPLLLCADDGVEFKFVVLKADGTADWEPLMHNRRLALSEALEEVQFVAEWGSPAVAPHYRPSTLLASPGFHDNASPPPTDAYGGGGSHSTTPNASAGSSRNGSQQGSVHDGRAATTWSQGGGYSSSPPTPRCATGCLFFS